MKKENIISIFKTLQAHNPEPKSELFYTNTYTLLVTVVLSAQATDKSVIKVTENLFKHISTPQDMLNLGENTLKDTIKSIGLYKTKAENIIKLSQRLITEHKGEVPNNQQHLKALAGVGPKTANVIRNTAFNEPTIAMDTHVFRVSNRTGIATGKNIIIVENKLCKIIPEQFKLHAHLWLVLHGRYVCKARTPLCRNCAIKK